MSREFSPTLVVSMTSPLGLGKGARISVGSALDALRLVGV